AGASDRIVEDLLGRRVVIPENLSRLVALAPNITEIVFDLGKEKMLVGVTTYSDYPEEAKNIPKVGSYIHLDLERIVALQPDLCLAIKDGNPIDTVMRLEALGIPVYAVDPRNLESVMRTLVRVGGLLHAEDKAEDIVADMRKRISRVDAMVAYVQKRPRVFFQIGVAPIVSIGSDTFIHELVVRAGGKNVAEGPVSYPRFGREQVIGLSPDVIIITSMARAAAFEEIKSEWSQWTNVPAVRTDSIFIQESNLFDRPSPRLVDALEVLVKLIHPELFEETD
ncbi:MAG: cobalamin-binding protein, partial [Deltaproteobacteria bacterium]|nr:cobalamin-binding protein [Deltaproteobacteria bacterium]